MNQEQLEEYFSESKAREYVLDLMLSDDSFMDAIVDGTALLEAWCVLPSTYDTKAVRRDTLSKMDIYKIVQRVFTDTLLMTRPVTLANAATTLGISLGFQEAKQGITLAGEILAVLANIGVYSLYRKDKKSTYYLYPNVTLNDEQFEIAHRGMYLPPCIELPQRLIHNRSTPYKTLKNDSLILGGQYNHHDYWVSCDVLNTQNKIPLTLNIDFLNKYEEEATFDLDYFKGMEKLPVIVAREMLQLHKRNWENHKEQSYFVYQLMADEGNKFYIPNKVDKRGRIYAQGHHINPMGSSFKKSSIDLYHKEKVNVPKGFFNEQ